MVYGDIMLLSLLIAAASCYDFLFESPVVVVFVYSSLFECSRELRIMQTLAPFFKENVTIQTIDAEVHRIFVQSTNVYMFPSLLYFQNGHYAGAYYGQWTEDSIIDWIETLGYPNTRNVLTTPQAIQKFRKTSPVNLIIFAPPGSAYAATVLESMGFLVYSVPCAFVFDESLLSRIGASLSTIQINRPIDDYSVTASRFTPATLQRKLFPRIKPITSSNVVGQSSRAFWSIASFVNPRNESHVRISAKALKKAAAVFERHVLLQTCSFSDCDDFIKQRGITRTDNPAFIVGRKDHFGNAMFMTFPEESPYMEVRRWVRNLM